MTSRRRALFLAVVFAGNAETAVAQASSGERTADWHVASVAYLYGFTWNAPSRERDILTADYANAWELGDNFAFIDISNLATRSTNAGADPSVGGTTMYAEWQARFSPGRILLGRSVGWGPVRDFMSAHELNVGPGLLVHLHGVGLAWNAPSSSTVKTNFYVRDNRDQDGVTSQISVAVITPVRLGRAAFVVNGFADMAGHEGTAPRQFVSNVQVLLDAGGLLRGRFYVGSELAHVTTWVSPRARSNTVPQIMIKWGSLRR